ncbi:LTA synthase family protein [Clostridium fermenticellae]|uniref:LTA synthase family protein n=1 Tax=Clostridium fermenticellae TaxID=2068654 RepID=A0A386H515_9CLOT|nr:LTA synthase family protein [Clostridium fermenticellae]AYD40746.1 LTA synthase family protein [Clostridium fermenticellae]
MDISKLINNKVSDHIIHGIDLLFFAIVISIKVIVYATQISPDYLYIKVFYPIVASILILVSFAALFKGKKRMKFLYIMDIIVSIILVADIMYYRYFKDILTVSEIGNARLLGGVSSSVGSLFNIKDILYFVDIIVLSFFIRKFNKKTPSYTPTLLKRFLTFIFIFIIGFCIDVKSVYAVSQEQPTLLSSMSNRIYLTKLIGNLNFHAIDAYNFVSTKAKNLEPLSDERKTEITNFLKSNNQYTTTDLKGSMEGKNVIMIQVEALQQFVINQKINGQEITPNLNRWLGKSLYFDNYFYQVAGGTTADAEFMSNNSLYPSISGAAYYNYSGDTLSSLAKELKDKNYYTAALHGNTEGFWNRNVMYRTESFDKFYGKSSLNSNEIVGLGISDRSFLNQSIEKLKSFKQPYYSFIITLSSHYPYDDVKHYGNFNVGEYEGTLMGNYLKAIHYTDEQLGTFLDKLDNDGITKNSVIVLYGDHFAIPKTNADQLFKFEGTTNTNDLNWINYQKVPLMIHFPDDKNSGVNHTYSGQMDLYPTLANLLNLPKNYMLGQDMLNTSANNKKVIFRDGSFTDGKTYYCSSTNTYYDIQTGKTIQETPELKNKKVEYSNELTYSDDILNHNLLKTLENK